MALSTPFSELSLLVLVASCRHHILDYALTSALTFTVLTSAAPEDVAKAEARRFPFSLYFIIGESGRQLDVAIGRTGSSCLLSSSACLPCQLEPTPGPPNPQCVE